MTIDEEKWSAVLNNLDKLEAVNAGLVGLTNTVGSLQTTLGCIEEAVGDTDLLKGATIVGTLNVIIAMIENIQKTLPTKD